MVQEPLFLLIIYAFVTFTTRALKKKYPWYLLGLLFSEFSYKMYTPPQSNWTLQYVTITITKHTLRAAILKKASLDRILKGQNTGSYVPLRK